MSDESVPATANRWASLGTSCAMVSAMMTLYAADYIFLRMVNFEAVFKSVKVNVPVSFDLMNRYGPYLCCAVAVCVVVSFHQALRHGGSRRALGINVTVAVVALCLAFLAREAVWQPFMSMFQGIGAEK